MINRRSVLQGGGLLAASAFLAACSAGGGRLAAPTQVSGRSDINAHPRAAVRDGGDLRWPLDQLPDNFNINQVDGPSLYGQWIMNALMPTLFTATQDGGVVLNRDYLVSAEVTSASPQVVTYTINPKATWSDGTPITWADFEAQWKALSGTNSEYLIATKTGYENISSVRRGTDDKQAIVTFGAIFAEWQALFGPLYPASTNAHADVFNSGWIGKIPVTAGPFAVGTIDLGAKTLTVKRDPRWWATPTKLDTITFRVFERAALADALANKELDFYLIGSSVDLFRRAQTIPGISIREASDSQYSHITFNGAPGSILADVKLRSAIAKGIDRHGIAARTVGPIVPTIELMGDHLYPFDSKNYHDNSGILAFNQAIANQELDSLGWVRQGATRTKNGQQLVVRYVNDAANPISEAIAKTVLDQLGQIGVHMNLETVPSGDFFKQYVNTGNFDLTGFIWQSATFPFSSSQSIYAEPVGKNVQQNYGRITSPEIDALFRQGLAELDDAKRADIGNQIDKLIWQEVHHLPIYPGTGAVAVRSTLANFGASGFADIDYINSGFVK